ncbi:MAG: DUF3160 domain-containing protein [Candidatus Hodarchaeales archaeon]|jgi:hypothetical protein
MKRKIPVLSVLIILFLSQLGSQNIATQFAEEKNDLSSMEYFELFNHAFNFTEDELALLDQNGFFVLNRLGTDDILDAYKYYWEEDLPIFITTDTMLQLWHLVFDNILEQSEEYLFFPLLETFCREMLQTFTNQIVVMENDSAVQDALVYLSVGAKLANSSVNIPQSIEEITNQILDAIYDEITIFDAVENRFLSKATQRFIDDFSQYKPRGHYTRSDNLMRYFRLFKWFSRIPFFFDVNPANHIMNRSPEEMIRSAVYLVWNMKQAHISLTDLGINANGMEVWNSFKEFLDPLVGETYMVTPAVLDEITRNVINNDAWYPDDVTEADIESIQNQVLDDNTIPAPKDPFIIDALIPNVITSPKAMLLFGERLTLDTYALNHLVYPYVPQKFLPNGLDFATTVLESDRASSLLPNKDYMNYLDMINQTQEELQNWPIDEKQTLSWKWLEALKHLTPLQPGFNENAVPVTPEFMKTGAWRDEKLTTVLGSWAQLKHDTILYAKQGIGVAVCSTPEGYVEPYPEFYNALSELSESFKNSLMQLESIGFTFDSIEPNWMGFNSDDFIYPEILNNFTAIAKNLERIAFHELQGLELTDEEKGFIRDTYSENRIGSGSDKIVIGWLGKLLGLLTSDFQILSPNPNTRSSLVADIFTSIPEKKILEVATGYLEHLVVILPSWNGTDILAVGPVFSYYEFITPMSNRLTDEDWRGILNTRVNENIIENYPYAIFPRGFWAQSYMTSTEMTTSIIYDEDEKFNAPQWFLNGSAMVVNSSYPAEIFIPASPITYSSGSYTSTITTEINLSTSVPGLTGVFLFLTITTLIVVIRLRQKFADYSRKVE